MPSDRTLTNQAASIAFNTLVESHGNAFVVGGGAREPYTVAVVNWAPLLRPLTKAEATNLAAWLIMVADIRPQELLTVLKANGVTGSMLDVSSESPAHPECPGSDGLHCGGCIDPAKRQCRGVDGDFLDDPNATHCNGCCE